ncbi:MAG: Non-heme chloroperoxidase, partial [uncultured Sphingomonadaceae bacterium]
KSEKNPGGLPVKVFDDMRAALIANRAEFYRELTVPFYGWNRDGTVISDAIRDNWWRQGMMGGAKAHYDCIAVFSETDFTEDLRRINIPLLIMHGDDDQIVPIADSALLAAEIAPVATLKVYPGFPHGMATTQAEVTNRDLLAFIQAEQPSAVANSRQAEPLLAHAS